MRSRDSKGFARLWETLKGAIYRRSEGGGEFTGGAATGNVGDCSIDGKALDNSRPDFEVSATQTIKGDEMSTATVTQNAAPETTAASPAVQGMSLEDKILLATKQSETVIALFSPQIAAAVEAGVEVEPLVSGLAKLVIGVFHHHAELK